MNIVEFQKKYDSDWLDKDGYLVDFNLGLPENVVLKSKKDYETLRMEYNKTNECDSIQGRLDFCTKYNINID